MRTFNIEPLHAPSMEECRLRIDNLTKPIYSLATLELIAERFAGILANPKPNHLRHGVLIVAADHLVDGPQIISMVVKATLLSNVSMKVERLRRGRHLS